MESLPFIVGWPLKGTRERAVPNKQGPPALHGSYPLPTVDAFTFMMKNTGYGDRVGHRLRA